MEAVRGDDIVAFAWLIVGDSPYKVIFRLSRRLDSNLTVSYPTVDEFRVVFIIPKKMEFQQ